MIFSCLVDADFRDTEAFYASVNDQAIDRRWPALPDIIADLVARLDAHLGPARCPFRRLPTSTDCVARFSRYVRSIGRPAHPACSR